MAYTERDEVYDLTNVHGNFDDAVDALLENLIEHLQARLGDEVHDANDVDIRIGIHLRHKGDEPEVRITYDAEYLKLRMKKADVFLSIVPVKS